jgi:hypothetical protein
VVEGLKFLSNEEEVLPLLHQIVEDLDTLWRRCFAPGGIRGPEALELFRVSESALSMVRKFFGRQSRSEALRQRVERLGRQLSGTNEDPGIRLVVPVLRKLVAVSADPTPGRHRELARALLDCFDATASLPGPWRGTGRAVVLRTDLVREAFAQIRSSHVDPDRESVEEVREARRHLLAQLVDLERALAAPAAGDPPMVPAILAHLEAIRDARGGEDAPRLRAIAGRLVAAASRLPRSPAETLQLEEIAQAATAAAEARR